MKSNFEECTCPQCRGEGPWEAACYHPKAVEVCDKCHGLIFEGEIYYDFSELGGDVVCDGCQTDYVFDNFHRTA